MSQQDFHQVQKRVNDYLEHVQSGGQDEKGELADLIFRSAHKLNRKYGNETGTKAIYDVLKTRIDIKGTMKKIGERNLSLIKDIIRKNTTTDQLVGGGEPYSLLEVVLCVIFFPWSLIYILKRK